MPTYISIDEINDGMILSEAIINNFGQTLMPSGANLTQKHKVMLKTWNVSGVLIKSENGEDDETINPAILASMKAKVLAKANWTPRNRIEDEIFVMAAMKLITFPKIK